jgi:hypothetical protein
VPEGLRKVALANTTGTEEEGILLALDEGAGAQLTDGRLYGIYPALFRSAMPNSEVPVFLPASCLYYRY